MDVNYAWGSSLSSYVPVQKLEKHFSDTFFGSPLYYVKVPGRVNLIGEHVDYCGYSVFPMAIDQCILVAGRITDTRCQKKTTVVLTNLNSARYPNVCEYISDIR